jgi:uncharacterized integral membrane protein (TIGR00698 family)
LASGAATGGGSGGDAPGAARRLAPGVLLAAAVVAAASWLADRGGAAWMAARGTGGKSPIPAATVAVILGILLANTLGTPRAAREGIVFCVKVLLRWGIVCVGIRLSLGEVVAQGAAAAAAVVLVVAAALAVAPAVARALGLSARLGLLAAASTAICGVTAALAVAPVVEAEEKETAYTVANVTLYGLLGMLLYPWAAHALLGGDPGAAGLLLGTAIHDTSQVAGAALSYRDLFGDEAAMKAALVAKLARNSLLVAVVPCVAWLHLRGGGAGGTRPPLSRLFPLFVLGFVAMALARTAGDALLGEAAGWRSAVDGIAGAGTAALLPAAMAGVGLTTDLRDLRGLGLRPLWLGASVAVLVGAVAFGAALLLG